MRTVAGREIEREYRVARQMVAMHADLRDTHGRLGLGLEIMLLVCTAALLSTTFAGDEFFNILGVAPAPGRVILGVVSTLAFAGSLVLLLLDPRGTAAKHGIASDRWAALVLQFRQARSEEGTWSSEEGRLLSAEYARTGESCCPIPDRAFNRLKSRYLRKVAVSELKSAHSSCPRIILSLLCRWRDTRTAWRALRTTKTLESKDEKG